MPLNKQRFAIVWPAGTLTSRSYCKSPSSHYRRLQLSADTLARCDIWGKWCEARGVRKCPCKPWVVASYLLEQSANGVPAQVLVAMLEAITALHDYHNLSNPTATHGR